MTVKDGRMPPEPTKTFKLGKWLGAAIQRVVKLVIRFPVAIVLTILGLAVAAAFIILSSVIIAVIALVCALIVLWLPFAMFFGYGQMGVIAAKLNELSAQTKAAAKAVSNVHPIKP